MAGGCWLLFLPGKFSAWLPGLLQAPPPWSAASSGRYLILGLCKREGGACPCPALGSHPEGRALPAPPGEELKGRPAAPQAQRRLPHHAHGPQHAPPGRAPGSRGRAASSIRPECHHESRRVPGPRRGSSELHGGVPVRWRLREHPQVLPGGLRQGLPEARREAWHLPTRQPRHPHAGCLHQPVQD